VLRLMKALRHEAPGIADTAKRLGIKDGNPVAYVLKTVNTSHGGKMSVARVLSGKIGDGITLASPDSEAGRVAATFALTGQHNDKRGPAEAGETVAFGKLDHAKTGDTLTAGSPAHAALA
jgi:elongation factor G